MLDEGLDGKTAPPRAGVGPELGSRTDLVSTVG